MAPRASKRKQRDGHSPNAKKRRYTPPSEGSVKPDLLHQCYSNVTTLKNYVLSKLPSSSRLRRKKIASLASHPHDPGSAEASLAHLLETTLVCSHELQIRNHEAQASRWQKWISFSQNGEDSRISLSDSASAIYSQSEVVDFVIWLLFSKEKTTRPKHLLCDGFRKTAGGGNESSTVPGVFNLYPNANVKMVREGPWPQLLLLLGKSGERIMIDLLVDCSIYLSMEAGFQNYYQLTGLKSRESEARRPSEMTLVRSRIFYAKPALTAAGTFQPGFRHIHVLNRCPHRTSPTKSKAHLDSEAGSLNIGTFKLMMYIFPRQFGLHNAFTSTVDQSITVQKFQDYTSREEEIAPLFSRDDDAKENRPKLPKRLRGKPKELVERLQVLHSRCSYFELLKHHCPTILDQQTRQKPQPKRDDNPQEKGTQTSKHRKRRKNRPKSTSSPHSSLPSPGSYQVVELATPLSQVSAFCQAVLKKIVPNCFWGEGDTREHNLSSIMRRVDHFIRLRRFETMSLHEVCQDLKFVGVEWLQPPGLCDQKLSMSDSLKRQEILHEFLYYVFDSLLIPLIRNNFYVTESNKHRYQVFYFRHDVWRLVADPYLASMKDSMFDEVRQDHALRILDSRKLGFSQVRLLPKGSKLRPIMNLRRKTTRKQAKGLQPSINAILGPIHTLLKHEKVSNPSMLGSAMFSVSDIYARLKSFTSRLGASTGSLYFAKLDVEAAFDTIPQDAAVRLMQSVPEQKCVTLGNHAEVKAGDRPALDNGGPGAKPIRRWHSNVVPSSEGALLQWLEEQNGLNKRKTVFVNNALRRTYDTAALLNLLEDHVQRNLVKIGKRYYRQKKGIPQGSVLSSFLCNYFYADLEIHHLAFTDEPDSLLLRLIDDFLLITLDKSKAERFIEVMHDGLPEYGVHVNRDKTLVNFTMATASGVTRCIGKGERFPYCGTMIDCKTLEISKDRGRDKAIPIHNSLTVDFGRAPGQNFGRKVLNYFKIQSHLMFYDTAHNSTKAVLESLREALTETAAKMCAYLRLLPSGKRPNSGIVIRVIAKVSDVAFQLLTGKSRRMRFEQYACDIRKAQVTSVSYAAFLGVLERRQTSFAKVIHWLRQRIDEH